MQLSLLRTRWAAIGAAVAVTLGAGGIGLVSATSPTGAVAYVPIEPCRAADTRPGDDNVGPRATPIGTAETHVVNSNDGQCSGDVPGTATGLQLNVTAVGASEGSFITIWASGARPLASSLNPTPGEPPVPNAVTTGITGAGDFNLYNNAGSVHVIVDIVGFYTDHQHDGDDIIDGSLTGADVADESLTGADIDDNTLTSVDIRDEPGVASNFSRTATTFNDATVKRTTAAFMRVPADGYVVVEASGVYSGGTAGEDQAWCQLRKNTTPSTGLNILSSTRDPWTALADKGSNTVMGFSTHSVFEVDVADNPLLFFSGQSFSLDCLRINGTLTVSDVIVTATYYPSEYEPNAIIISP